jgi:hypothetical protein
MSNRCGHRYRQPRAPAPQVDPFQLGVRQAKAGSPKTGSVDWVESGQPPEAWFDYSLGYDGHTQRRAA